MADLKTHAVAGAVVGVGAYLIGSWFLQREISFSGTLLAGLGGIAAGCVPDLIEPALHPNHRGTFHSLTAGSLFALSGYEAFENGNLDGDARITALVLVSSYVSHLILDAVTPKSIPFI